jgi:hypothetical protein
MHPATLTDEPAELETLWRLAQRISRTAFAGDYRGRPDDAFAAILAGREAGLAPMQSLTGIHVIDGRPAFSPELMRALVARAGHRLDVLEATDQRCTLAGVRADTGAGAQVTWTIADAQRAGIAGKGAWRTYPRAMLAARATAELCRLLWPDIIAGLSYTDEEAASIRGGEWHEPATDIDADLPVLEQYTGAVAALDEIPDDPAAEVFTAVKALAGTPAAIELRELANRRGRRLSAAEFADYPAWRAEVAGRVAELVSTEPDECAPLAELPAASDDESDR